MKTTITNTLLSLLCFGGALCAAERETPVPVSPQYNHRAVMFDPGHVGYEYMPNDDLYIGANLHAAETYAQHDRTAATIAYSEVRLGRSFFYNGQDHVRPIVGGGIYRDLTETEDYACGTQGCMWKSVTKNPCIAYGLIGAMAEHEFNNRLAIGLNAKLLMGGIAGKRYGVTRDFYYGGDISLPITIRIGEKRAWDLRLEPFALVMNDGTRYIGHRSSFGLRF